MSTRVQHVESANSAVSPVTLAWSAPPTANSVLIAWANSDATVTTPSGFTLIDSQINGNGAYVWYKVAAGGDANVTFSTTAAGETITCGIIEISGVSAAAPNAHNAIYASGTSTGSPPADITNTVSAYILGFAFLHSLPDDPTLPGWSSVLTNFADVVSNVDPTSTGNTGHYCHAFVGDASALASATRTLNATWTGTTGNDRNTFLVALAEQGTTPTPDAAAGTAAALTTAGATVKPSIVQAAGTGAAADATIVTFTGDSAPGGQATGTGAANTVTVKLGPTPATTTAVGAAGDGSVVFTGPTGGSGVAWPAGPKVAANAGIATGTGAVNATSNTVSRTAGIATATGTARQPTVTFGTADVVADAGVATGTGTAWRPGFTVSFTAAPSTGTGTALTPVAWLQPNGELATAQGVSYSTDTSESLSVAEGAGTAYDATTSSPVELTFTFTPPSWDQIPPIAEEATALSNRLMRFFKARPMGRNIWVLPDGTCTFVEPWPLVEDTEANRAGLFPADPPRLGSSWSNVQTVTYTKVYWGGHTYALHDILEIGAIAQLLSDEGYDPNDWLVQA